MTRNTFQCNQKRKIHGKFRRLKRWCDRHACAGEQAAEKSEFYNPNCAFALRNQIVGVYRHALGPSADFQEAGNHGRGVPVVATSPLQLPKRGEVNRRRRTPCTMACAVNTLPHSGQRKLSGLRPRRLNPQRRQYGSVPTRLPRTASSNSNTPANTMKLRMTDTKCRREYRRTGSIQEFTTQNRQRCSQGRIAAFC